MSEQESAGPANEKEAKTIGEGSEKEQLFRKEEELFALERKLAAQQSKTAAAFRGTVSKLKDAKLARNQANSKIAILRARKAQIYSRLSEINAKLKTAYDNVGDSDNQSAAKLRSQIGALEWKQQTEANGKLEKELAVKIRALFSQLPAAEQTEEAMKSLFLLKSRKNEVITQLNSVKLELSQAVELTAKEHRKVIELQKEADETHVKNSSNWEALQKARQEISGIKENIGKLRSEERKIEDAEFRQRESEKESKKTALMKHLQQQAQEIEAKLKSGKKISLHEIQILAESGN